MARKPSDDIRDAARRLKVEAQRNPRVLAPGTTTAFSDKTAHPKVNNPQTDLKIDHKESHHLMPVDAYTSYTEGMTPEQIAAVDARAESQRFYKGDNNLNRTDLWKRYHTGRSKGVYQGKGAHQVANQAGVDGPTAKTKWAAMTPDERFANLDLFMEDMVKNRNIGFQANMDARMLLGNANTVDNIYGGNFSQRILNPRNPELAASTARKTKLQREFLKSNKATKALGKALKIPLASGLIAAGGTLLSGGSAEAAATNFIDAENPIDGGALGDGTLKGAELTRSKIQQREQNIQARKEYLKANPTQERGYETLGRLFNTGFTKLKDAANKAFNTPR